ncbi:MAG: 4-(cytidine 5'-diphospho)-2-C-methyl-D-erythritol kinase [Candidatus Brocadiia bacterium]
MPKLKLRSPAKVNLYLKVAGKRPDGYHELESIFQTIGLSDQLEISESRRGISITTDDAGLSTGKDNLVYRATELFKREYHIRQGVRISLTKRIPVGGGLGGGSSNAASTLTGLNRLWKLGLSRSELALQAAKIGSDVPFFIYGGTALVKGRGEIIFPLAIKQDFHYLLIFPGFPVPTKNIYRNLKLLPAKPDNNINTIIQYLTAGDIKQISRLMHNDLEPVALRLYPELMKTWQTVKRIADPGVMVSGSGSTIFKLCSSSREALRLAKELRRNLSAGKPESRCDIFTSRYIPDK